MISPAALAREIEKLQTITRGYSKAGKDVEWVPLCDVRVLVSQFEAGLTAALQDQQAQKEDAIKQFRMDELEAVMLSVDKWLDYMEDDPKRPNPATRAAEARQEALTIIEDKMRQISKLKASVLALTTQLEAANRKADAWDETAKRLDEAQSVASRLGLRLGSHVWHALLDYAIEAEADLADLRRQLQIYGTHHYDCACQNTDKAPVCTCGFTSVVSEADASDL